MVDLASFNEKSLDPEILIPDLVTFLRQFKQRNPKMQKIPSGKIFMRFFFKPGLKTCLIQTSQKVTNFLCILLLEFCTDSMKEGQKDDSKRNLAIGSIYLLVLGYFLMAYVDSRSKYQMTQLMARIKMVGQFLIYQKSLVTQCFTEYKKKEEGEEKGKTEKKNESKNEEDDKKEEESDANINVRVFSY